MSRHSFRSRRPFRPFATLAFALLLTACVRGTTSVETAPLVTDRPDFTESAVTVPHGRVQVEGGHTVSREAGVTSSSTGEMLVRAGLTPRVELRLTTASYAIEGTGPGRTEGFEDAGIGFKFAIHDGADRPGTFEPTLALIAGTSLPTGASAFRSRDPLPEVKFLASWDITERFGFASNVNWATVEGPTATHDEWSGSASIAAGVTERIGAYAEYYAFVERAGGWLHRGYVNGGLTYLVHDDFQLDVRVGSRTDSGARGFFAGVGIARRF